jgi:hypothetical protein
MKAFEVPIFFSFQFTIPNYTFRFCAAHSLQTSALLCLQYNFHTAAVATASTFDSFRYYRVSFFSFTNIIFRIYLNNLIGGL